MLVLVIVKGLVFTGSGGSVASGTCETVTGESGFPARHVVAGTELAS